MSLSLEAITTAKKRISPFAVATPLLESPSLGEFLKYKGKIFLKLECEQPTGSFKIRGALNKLLQIDPAFDKVAAFSSGNFAQAVAYASSKLNKQALIVMPQNAPKVKKEGTLRYGARIVFCGENHESGPSIVAEYAEKENYLPVHPFDDFQIMAGQGTISIEILEQAPSIKHFFAL